MSSHLLPRKMYVIVACYSKLLRLSEEKRNLRIQVLIKRVEGTIKNAQKLQSHKRPKQLGAGEALISQLVVSILVPTEEK